MGTCILPNDTYTYAHIDTQLKITNDFEKIILLGSGSFGNVYLVKHKQTNDIYAMKSLNKNNFERNIERAITEYNILVKLSHPFISKLHFCFQTKEELHIIMQYCAGGNFYDVIKRQPNRCLTESQTQFYSACVLLGLEYLHFNGIIYRDLKPENILMCNNGWLKWVQIDTN